MRRRPSKPGGAKVGGTAMSKFSITDTFFDPRMVACAAGFLPLSSPVSFAKPRGRLFEADPIEFSHSQLKPLDWHTITPDELAQLEVKPCS